MLQMGQGIVADLLANKVNYTILCSLFFMKNRGKIAKTIAKVYTLCYNKDKLNKKRHK